MHKFIFFVKIAFFIENCIIKKSTACFKSHAYFKSIIQNNICKFPKFQRKHANMGEKAKNQRLLTVTLQETKRVCSLNHICKHNIFPFYIISQHAFSEQIKYIASFYVKMYLREIREIEVWFCRFWFRQEEDRNRTTASHKKKESMK